MSEIRCDKHGMQARTLACQHIAYGLVHKERVGSFWIRDDFSAAVRTRGARHARTADLLARVSGLAKH